MSFPEEQEWNDEKNPSVELRCFKCWGYLEKKGAVLFSPPIENTSSDNVDTVQKFHLCSNCFTITLDLIMFKESPNFKDKCFLCDSPITKIINGDPHE